MYDLHPVSLSARSNYVRFTPEVIEALSSQRHLEHLSAPVVVVYGTLETPEFQRQNREFAAAVKAAGKPVTLLVGEGYNHFEIQETLGNPYGVLGRAALLQMQLPASAVSFLRAATARPTAQRLPCRCPRPRHAHTRRVHHIQHEIRATSL